MAITQSLCTSFKVDILTGAQNFTAGTGNTYKMALYTSSATLGATTTAYTTSNEITGTGYTAGGNTLVVSVSPTSSGTTAFLSFSDTTWTNATFTCRGALIYNSTNANKAVAVFDFGSDKQVVGGTFTITFPTADASSAVIRIA
jgi:hypothetical protein